MGKDHLNTQLFDEYAAAFAIGIDAALSSGGHVRTQMFTDSVAGLIEPGAPIVDFGCGPGRIARAIATCVGGHASIGASV